MRKQAETSHANKGYNLAILSLYQFCRFQDRSLGCNFQTNESGKTPVYWIKHGEKKLTHDERLAHENLLIK